MESRSSGGNRAQAADATPLELVDVDEFTKDSSWTEFNTADSECGSSFTLLTDAQLRSSASSYRGSRQSPRSVHSGPTSAADLSANLESVKLQLARKLNAEQLKTAWVRDWSSRPEAVPPFGYPHALKAHVLFTPPNSPYCDGDSALTVPAHESAPLPPPPAPVLSSSRFSLRHSRLIHYDWFSVEVISAFVCGHLVSFIIGLYIGLCIRRRRFPGLVVKHLP